MTSESAENVPMDTATQLAALAVVQLTARQIVTPDQAQDHRDELAVIMRDVDPVMVSLEIATILAGIVFGTQFPIGQLIEEKRARIIAAG